MKARLIAAGLLGLWIGSTGIAGDVSGEHNIFLVDISGSMLKSKGATPTPIHVRQELLRNWLNANASSSVTLISFNTHISSPQTFNLANANELAKALQWINELQSNKPRGTHLWTCLSKTLHVSADWIKQHPKDSVVLHVFTDRLDTERTVSFGDAIKDFAEVNPRQLPANGGGDFELRIVKKSEETTTNGGPRTKDSTPTPTPTPTSTPTPILTPTPTGEAAAFEIQEPRIVSSGQFVHFINKTSPPADSYFWTIRENPRRCHRVKSGDMTQPADSEVELPAEHLVYQFCNDGTQPRSYTVFLTATRGAKASVSPPISILVQGSRQTWAARVSSINLVKLLTDIGTVVTCLGTIITGIGALRSKMKQAETKAMGGPAFAGEISDTNTAKYHKLSIAFAVLFVFFVIFLLASTKLSAVKARTLAEQPLQSAKELKVTQPPGQPSVPGQGSGPNTPVTVINNIPNHPISNERGPATVPSSTASTILVVLVTIVIIVAIAAAAEFVRRQGKEFPTAYSSWSSLMEQLSEIDRLREKEIIPFDEWKTFREAILRQLSKRYGVAPKDSGYPRPPVEPH